MMVLATALFLLQIDMMPFLSNHFIDRISSRYVCTDKHKCYNIAICFKIYLKQHLVMLGNIILNEEYEIALLKCNNA